MPSDATEAPRGMRLRFDRPDVEARFRDDSFDRSLPFLRLSIVLGAILYSAFGALDYVRWPELAPQFWAARAAIVAMLLATLALSYTPVFRAVVQLTVASVAFAAGLAIVWMMSLTNPPDHIYYVGLIIIVFYAYHFLRVRFAYATAVSWLMLAAYDVMALTVSPVDPVELVTVNFFLVTANIVGMISGYFSEFYIRRDFEKSELLQEHQRQFASIADNLPGAVFRRVVRPDGTIRYPYVSASLMTTLERDPQELVGNPDLVFGWVHPDDLEAGVAEVGRHDETLEPLSMELRFLTGTGGIKWLRISARAYRAANGDRVWDGVALDITDLKQREDELRQAQKMEAVGQLTGGVAHDFNNLLTVVIGNLDLYTRKVGEDGPGGRLIASALASARRGSELTRRLLAFSRRQALQPVPVDLNALVAGMSEMIERTLGAQVDVAIRVRHALPPASADPAQVENALLNLSLNARDAMVEGGRLTIETGELTVDTAEGPEEARLDPGRYVWLGVSDTGTGMLPEVRERAFEPFFTTKASGAGSGLGLSMIYGFARQSGGTVRIYSEEGVGTTVRLILPVAAEAAAACGPAQPAHEDKTRAVPGQTVLVIEDDDAVRALAAEMLDGLGYTVRAFADGPSALRAIEGSGRVDLLFTDVALPGGMTGTEVAARARLERPDLRVLYTSGFAAQHLLRAGSVPEGVELLNKPYTMTELATAVHHALDRTNADALAQ